MPHLTSLDSLITPPSIIEDYSYGLHQGLNVHWEPLHLPHSAKTYLIVVDSLKI